MIDVNLETDRVTGLEAQDILTRHTSKLGILIDLDKVLDYVVYFTEKLNEEYRVLRPLAGSSAYKVTSTNDTLNLLKFQLGIPDLKLMDENRKYTTSSEKLLELSDDGSLTADVRELCGKIREMKSWSHAVSSLKSYVNLPQVNLPSYDGHRMVLAQPDWDILATERFSSANPNIQGLSRQMVDIITYAENQTMIYSDSAQIEPRIQWSYYTRDELIVALINLYGDAYYGLLHYCTLTPEEKAYMLGLVRKATSEGKREYKYLSKKDLPKSNRDILKTIILATSYESQGRSDFDPVIYSMVKHHLQEHPARLEWMARIKRDVASGVETFYSAFGTPVTPESNTRYHKGTPAWRGHVERCGLNNPIQATAGDFMKISVKKADILMSTYAVSSFTAIAGYIHDAGMFYVSKNDKGIIDELMGYLSYRVPGWAEIPSEAKEGQRGGLLSAA